jgi:hypothetical protein
MKMEEGNGNWCPITTIQELKEILENKNYYLKCYVSDNFVLIYNKEKKEGVRFDNHSVSYGMYSDCFLTRTAYHIIEKYNIVKEPRTLYFCERKAEILCSEKVKHIEETIKIDIKSPFNIPIKKLNDILWSKFEKEYPEIIEVVKKYNQ